MLKLSQEKGELLGPLQDMPILWESNQDYVEMWRDLNHSRSSTATGPGHIPVSEILAYCQLFDYDGYGERERILRRIMIIDEPFIREVQKRREQHHANSRSRNKARR